MLAVGSKDVHIHIPAANATVICIYDKGVVELRHTIEGDLITALWLDL